MKISGKIIKIIVVLLALIGIAGLGAATYSLLDSKLLLSTHFLSFMGGGILFLITWFFYFSGRDGFWGTLEHELTHALFALLFFKRIHSISASRRKGGLIHIEGRRGPASTGRQGSAVTGRQGPVYDSASRRARPDRNVVIALAPYFFPLATMIVLGIKPFIQLNYQVYVNFVLGFTYFFHLVNLVREFHPGQPDVEEAGMVFSLILVAFINIAILGILLSALPGEWQPVSNFLSTGLEMSSAYLKEIGTYLTELTL